MRLDCPHCGTAATIRTSRAISEITREASVQCTNIQCAHTWITLISAVRTIAPSMTPKRGVYIPLSPRSPAAVEAVTSNQLSLDIPEQNPRAMASG